MEFNEEKALEAAERRAFKLSLFLFIALFSAFSFVLYHLGLEAFSSSSFSRLRDEYGESGMTFTGLYLCHLCYYLSNRFYNHLLIDFKGFKVCPYDEFVKYKWIIGTTIFIIVRTYVVYFSDLGSFARAAIILPTLGGLIYWLTNWEYQEKQHPETN